MAGNASSLPGSTARAWWLRQLTLWHRITGAASLSILIFFAATGVFLNHPGLIPARVDTEVRALTLPVTLQEVLGAAPTSGTAPLPRPLANWLAPRVGVPLRGSVADFDTREVWIDLPRPGGEGRVIIDRATATADISITRRSWLALAADLHKGRNSGAAWPFVIDALALGTVLFALSGLGILAMHARARPATWPVTLGGLVLPAVLFLLFVHGG
ncbi:hypothetical protein DL237_03055 [Pseudooceanicola sediminis]|uniref:Peptidase n=1 Tax=Pseudooceanicola sediminis TaxID=2211117 RepID=A0A399J7W3_9RHOB|nr:PepSY-associated TM helix domain-containing protein [Pseudooceanicola sediminis]KAA2315485.1 hypothetical protein E0K93_06435 [Puniceibacterium sp. HSS470]RII40309.1 hypothetical protein DL237_03055 [Pseudooceanicola sediminis]|tara:strand:- start:123892 stop:124536 length:645 start_codon:yes stop_codon:yes gene_type:complete